MVPDLSVRAEEIELTAGDGYAVRSNSRNKNKNRSMRAGRKDIVWSTHTAKK
jgi:hypothetical protein